MLAIARLSGFRSVPEVYPKKMSSKIKPAPLPPGSTIGGYRVVRRLASGGFGVVYLALDGEGKQVAIKEYLPASLATRAPGELQPAVAPEKLSLYRLGLRASSRRAVRWPRFPMPPWSACSISSGKTRPSTW
jgi:serine/threonine protein kinase